MAREAVDHPAHYGGEDDPHEHVKCMEGTGLEKDAHLYNCTKYIWRVALAQRSKEHRKRGAPLLQDLKKARWYLNRRIKRMEETGK